MSAIVCQEKTHSARPRSSVKDVKSAQTGLHTFYSYAVHHNASPHYAFSLKNSNVILQWFIYLLQWFILQYTNQWIQFICNCCRCSSRLKLKVECYYNSQTSIQDHKSKRDVTKLSSMNCWLSVPLVSGARFLIRIHPLWSFFKYRFVLTPLFLFLLRYSASVQCLELIFIFFNDIDPISKSQVDYV